MTVDVLCSKITNILHMIKDGEGKTEEAKQALQELYKELASMKAPIAINVPEDLPQYKKTSSLSHSILLLFNFLLFLIH